MGLITELIIAVVCIGGLYLLINYSLENTTSSADTSEVMDNLSTTATGVSAGFFGVDFIGIIILFGIVFIIGGVLVAQQYVLKKANG